MSVSLWPTVRKAAAVLASIAMLAGAASAGRAPAISYASLKVERALGRHGPGLEHQIDWIYQRVGLPLQVTAVSGSWRRVRDPGGSEVWMHASNLSATRTAYVTAPRDVALSLQPRQGARVLALLAPGVVARLTGCNGDWRRIAIGGRVGWVQVEALWGAQDCAGL